MKVLLLHPEDDLPYHKSIHGWDLVVDFGGAPASTYEQWSKQAACPIISIYEFAKEIDDLRLCRNLLQSGMGFVVDRCGIDWWDILSLGIVPDLLKLVLVDRLAKYIDRPCELHSTRPFPLATALQNLLGCTLGIQHRPFQSITRRFRRYSGVLSKLDAAQLAQVTQDKFDRHHAMRRRLSRRKSPGNAPVILLPSAYVNVSRMAVRYAELLPDQRFLLVFARRSGKLQLLPPNVSMVPLDPYFDSSSRSEQHLFDEWQILRKRLCDDKIFRVADRPGMLEKVESGLRWGLQVRDAWRNVLDREPIVGCLCADDTNPYTRIALLLAKDRGIPTVACHHGALDCWMTIKNLAADSYLAKSEVERDYLICTCHVARERIVLGGPARPTRLQPTTECSQRTWMVFFTEAYEASGWRGEEVYRDLLPRLCSLAQDCVLKLVFKLHPFDSIRGHRRKLRRILGQKEREIEVVAGPLSDDLWQKTRFALTVESSTALECTAKGIPVFLCTWLRDPHAGYVQQYAKFGVGHAINSPEEITEIPHLLGLQNPLSPRIEESIAPDSFRGLFSTACCLAAASNA
jgi:hypothetical protein